MTYVITKACIGHREAECVAVCPVDCIHPTPDEPAFANADQLYIDPRACTDCDACIDECPWGAIYPDRELPRELAVFAARNAAYYSHAQEGH